MKKILLPLMVLIMVLGLALVPATPAALADDDPNVCLCELGPGLNLDLSGHGNSYVGRFHLYFDSVNCVGGELHYGWCVDLANPMGYWCFDANLVNAPRLTPWCEIAYIMTHFSPISNEEAAAIQLAIWKYIEGGKNNVVVTSKPVDDRANDIYDLAANRSENEYYNEFGPGLGLTLVPVGAPDSGGGTFSHSQLWTATITGPGCLDGIAVDFSTSNSFSDTTIVTETTVPTDAAGMASVTLYYDTTWSITASTAGEWPVIIEPKDLSPTDPPVPIQKTVILKPFGDSVTKSGQICTGTIRIEKVNDANNEEHIGGATFTIKNADGSTYLVVKDNDANDNDSRDGYIEVLNVPCGSYKVEETGVPDGWVLVTTGDQNVTVTNSTTTTPDPLVFKNTKCLGTIRIEKVNDANNEEHIGGATFTIKNADGSTYLVVKDNDANDNDSRDGYIEVLNVPCGSYKVEETGVPDGWVLVTTGDQNVTVTNSTTTTPDPLVFKNTKCLGTIRIEKVNDANNEEHIGGATFTIKNADGSTYLVVKDNDANDNDSRDGYIEVLNVPCGSYKVEETGVPDGWVLVTTGDQNVTVTNSTTTTPDPLVFKNTKCLGTIRIEKVNDANNEEHIGGATFTIKNADGSTYLVVKDNDANDNDSRDGYIEVLNVPCGSYKVEETGVPDGWVLVTTGDQNVTVTNSTTTTPDPLVFKNTKCLGTIRIEKVNDANNEEHIGGATFTIKNADGSTYLVVKDNDANDNDSRDGYIEVLNVPCGSYKVEETGVPDGWVLVTTGDQNVTVTNSTTTTPDPLVFKNTKCLGTIRIEKVNDANNEEHIGGATFTIKNADGSTYLVVKDNDANDNDSRDGYIEVLNVPCGSYKVEETGVPDGWVLVTTGDQNVTVTNSTTTTPDPLVFKNEREHCSIEVVKTALLCGEGQGCTPGYWKVPQHHDDWLPTGYITTQRVDSVFTVPSCVTVLADDTLLEALEYHGGDDVLGMAQNLLRIAVAAVLNAAHPSVNYPHTVVEVVAAVNFALATCDRDTMEILKDELDADNNLVCPFGEDPLNRGDACCPECCPGEDPLDVSVGDTVMYCYEVTNTSTGVTLTSVTVTDDIYGPVTLGTTTLLPGESTSGTLIHVVVEGDIPLVTNIATATGTLPGGTPVTDTDPCTINVGTVQIGATITGQKFQWVNCTGDRVPLGGWEIELWKINLSNGTELKVATTLTDEFGQFTFEDVAAGIYKVREVLQPDWEQCTDLPLREYYWVIVYGVDAATEATIAVDVYGYALLFGNSPLV